ncbi:hypothetical protein, partial [Dyella sp. ASV21]|uniref:hypothetical protein n=1 Tax=Dyella sp. ASV21 TaxID=2795114 RepID=UPI0018EB2BE3
MADDIDTSTLPADAVALSGRWGDYIQGVSSGGGRFQVVYRGGVEAIYNLTEFTEGTGVGVLEGPLSLLPSQTWESARKLICEGKDFGGMRPLNPWATGSARCPDGRMAGASGDSVVGGKDAKMLVGLLHSLLVPYYRHGIGPQGTRRVWLTAETYLAPAGNQLKVTLRLINSGQEDIVLRSPDQWEGRYNPMGSGYSYITIGGYDSLGHQIDLPHLGGSALAPGQEFTDGQWVIPAGQQRDVVFLTYPEKPFPAGSYETGGGLDFIHVLAPASLKGSVGMRFRHTINNRFERNFPADDAGRAELEGARRLREAHQPPLRIGDKVTEGGWYRAVSSDKGTPEQRDSIPRLFHTGDVLPPFEVMHWSDAGTSRVGEATGWRWEAYGDAQMTVRPGERCPRSGTWLPTLPLGAPEYFHAQVRPTRMEAGRPVLKFGLPSAAQENQV